MPIGPSLEHIGVPGRRGHVVASEHPPFVLSIYHVLYVKAALNPKLAPEEEAVLRGVKPYFARSAATRVSEPVITWRQGSHTVLLPEGS